MFKRQQTFFSPNVTADVFRALEEAQRAVAQITDPYRRSLAETNLGEALFAAGQGEQADKAFVEAQLAAIRISPLAPPFQSNDLYHQSLAASALAEALVAAGHSEHELTAYAFNLAIIAAARITDDPSRRAGAYIRLAQASLKTMGPNPLARAPLEEAQRAVTQVTNPDQQFELQSALAEALVTAGQSEQAERAFQEARRAAANIPMLDGRAEAETDLAQAFLKAAWAEPARTTFRSGMVFALAEAQRAAAQITDPYDRLLAETNLAEVLFAAGQGEQAESTLADAQRAAAQITDPHRRSYAEGILGKVLANRHNFAAARKIADHVEPQDAVDVYVAILRASASKTLH